jgi:NitT/TauT family transport system ATP-binding protein
MPQFDQNRILEAVSQENWEQAAAELQQLDPAEVAEILQKLPFEQQQVLFGHLPVDFAAKVVGEFPYYHQYVLLHSRGPEAMRAIVDKLDPDDRMRFFDELPEEAWQHLMDELSGAGLPRPEHLRPAAPVKPRAPRPAVPAEPIIEAKQVQKFFDQPDGNRIEVIAPTDLTLEPETIIALLGPSGSGKSTLLRMLSGLSKPSSGQVLWHGKPLGEANANVAIVFQSFALFPWLTVIENVEAPLVAHGMPKEEREGRAMRALDSVGLKGFENAYPKELSGGMKQRVGFARALAVEPEVLFMDEPFSALDVLTAENLRSELMELWMAKKIPTKSIFLVTHNIEEAVLLADRVIVLGRNPARIRANFRVNIPQPRERSAAEFTVYVDYIYKVMTQPEAEIAFPTAPGKPTKPKFQMLPHARPGGIAGLLELLNDRVGREDLYHLAEELRMEVDDLLPTVDAAVLLGFATLEEGDLVITPEGKAFGEASIPVQKTLFRDAVLKHVMLLQQMKRALDTKSDHAMPVEFFRDILDEHFSEAEVDQQIDTALNWGRYAEIFTYDSEDERLILLENGVGEQTSHERS